MLPKFLIFEQPIYMFHTIILSPANLAKLFLVTSKNYPFVYNHHKLKLEFLRSAYACISHINIFKQ